MSSTIIGSVVALMALAGGAAGWLLHACVVRRLERAGKDQERREQEEANLVAPCIRNTFCLALGHRLAESKRRGDPLSLILVRIDNYRRLYDRHGFHTSRSSLETTGKFLTASVRAMDWVARFDATTFALLLPDTALVHATGVAERLRTGIAARDLAIAGDHVQLTISTGTTATTLGDSGSTMLCRAEEAMEAAIQAGGNRSYAHVGRQLQPVQTAADPPERCKERCKGKM
jgi:diguanylate cyclase (GGDEF)-like protein